jgi:hypothetical protein
MQDMSGVSASTRTGDAKVEQLSREVAELRSAMEALSSGPGSDAKRSVRLRRGRREHCDEPGGLAGSVSRRRLFGLLGGAAAAGAGLAVAGSALGADPAGATAVTVGAADGDALQIGGSNQCSSQTALVSSVSSPDSGLLVAATGSGSTGMRASGDFIAVKATSTSSYGIVATGGHAPLQLVPVSAAGPPTGAHILGELVVDHDGTLFFCTTTGNPATWVNLSTGSNLVTLGTPSRVYDSRPGQPNGGTGNVQGSLTFTAAPPSAASRTIDCAHDSTTGTTVVPSTAKALLINLTVVPVSGVGALAVYATGASQPNSSSINWSPGAAALANGTTSACNATQHVDVAIVAATGASTNLIIDVIGYYV